MVFSSAIFLFLFLPIVYAVNFFLKTEISNVFLLIASLFFYAWGEPIMVLLMILAIVVNWGVGRLILKCSPTGRRLSLLVGILFDLGLLGYYKYAVFFVSILNELMGIELIHIKEIELPIGISFFIFQAISYIVDVYRGETDGATNLINVALYISFFPQLIAGPIVKFKDINVQIRKRKVTWFDSAEGFKKFIYGLAKKVLIANVLGRCVDIIYSFEVDALDCKSVWIGAISYSLQLYYDFSGYSDMAIGLGKMFGFNIPDNFDYPYLSKSISEFWRRWHISLGSWFREYVYIPLGGNKRGSRRTCFNLIVVFLLTGLWHGADVSFVVWGAYHAIFQIMERIGGRKIIDKSKILAHVYCFAVVNFGWVLFRAEGTVYAVKYIERMITPWRQGSAYINCWEYMDYKTIFVLGCAIVGIGVIQKIASEKILILWKDSMLEALYCVGLFVLCIASVVSNSYNPFIYFQF